MRPRWQVEIRFLCVTFILALTSALIPSLTDTVAAQETKAAVCQSFQDIMVRLLQHAARLKEAQTVYQGELEGEYLGLQDSATAATRMAARPDISQARKDQLVANLKALLVAIQETRANLRLVIQQQTKIGQQILLLRDLEAQVCAPASTATAQQPPKPAGSSAPQSGAVGPHLVLVSVTDNLDSVAHGDPGWQTHYQGYSSQSNSLVFVPDRNDVAAYGSMRVEWVLPKVMFSGAAYRITLSGSCINVPRGGAGVNLSAAPHPIFGAQPPQLGIFVGRGGDGSLRCDNQMQELALTPKVGAAARGTSYNIDVRVGGIAITYHYELQ